MIKESTHPLKVFLCHASGDKPPVRELYKRLTAEGVDAWLDQEKLLPGQDWRLEIPKAVQESDVVVICLSKKSITKEGYVQKEIKFALDIAEEKPEGAIFLIPARLEDCSVPERLSRWHWVDLYEENGFIKLLRSLKLRADAVGATIEPAMYEDFDKEVEKKLKQMYTEGLAAFYTEDWDRACHRFQSILSEQPNHKNASEKLEEAERQRLLAKLYEQATSAIRSEDWGAAIQTLEELSGKSANHKDVAQLLKNARKQEQLKELYAEAKTLHEAQKWEAVVKVFEQITAIDPNYTDASGLLPSAQKEVAEIKRLTDLNDLYSTAVSEMDAGNWIEARSLLEQVHKSQTRFLETERLLRKVEDEITKVEEQNKRNNQVNVLYEQAHGFVRSQKWRKALDKMEEIQSLDEQFVDKDGISEKAHKGLSIEEQEAERQNKLAAIYAEAVRLLKEEKYQEALDKWQEVKVIDPKYPDRQWVQRTVRKGLAETSRPIQIKPRFVITRSLWMGLVGLIVLGAVITGIIISGQVSQKPSLTSTSAPTKSIVISLPATNDPEKTSTPRPATATPTQAGYSDPTMYDDFDVPTFNGKYNTSLWDSDTAFGKIIQENGSLTIMGSGSQHVVWLNARQPFKPSYPTFVEANTMLDQNTLKLGSNIAVAFVTTDGQSICSIYARPERHWISCWSEYFGIVQKHYEKEIIPGTWHLLRIELFPDTMTFNYLVDNQTIGSYIPRSLSRLKDLSFSAQLHLNNLTEIAESPTGYIDSVRMGAIEDDSTLLFFDDLDGPVLSDDYKAFPTNPSYNYQGEPKFFFETIDGATVLRMQSILEPTQFKGWQISRIFNPGTNHILLEVRFNTLVQSSTTSIDAFLNVWLLDGDDSHFIWTGLSAWSYGSDRYFADVPFDFKDNTWYRLVITGSRDEEIRALLYEDKTGKEHIGVNLGNNLSMFKSGIKIGLMQQMGTPNPDAAYPTDVAIDWIRFSIIPER